MSVAGELVPKIPLFQWEIDTTTFDKYKTGDTIFSPQFSTYSHENFRENWQLVMYPKGDSEESSDWLSIFMKRLTVDAGDITVKISLSLLDRHNERVQNSTGSAKFKQGQPVLGFTKFVKESFLVNPKNDVLRDGRMSVTCKVISDTNTEESVNAENTEYLVRLKELDKYEKLLSDREFSDVTVTAEGRNFYLHKCILTTSSDVFQAMFTNDMMEKNQNTVTIEDIKYEVLEELFRFVYTGKVNDIEKIVGELLIAAEKYCIEGLKAVCEKKMCKYLSEDNAIEFLDLAAMNNAAKVKAEAIKYVSLHLEALIKTKEFEDFGKRNPELLIEIMKKYIHD